MRLIFRAVLPVFLPYMAVLMLFALALGIMITGLIFRYSTRLQTLAWSFAGLLGPVSCVMYPLSALPRFLRPVALTLPTTYAFEGMRQALSGGGFSRYRFGVALTLDGAYLVAALVGFRVLFEQARNRGLLVKFEMIERASQRLGAAQFGPRAPLQSGGTRERRDGILAAGPPASRPPISPGDRTA